jgi:hypothetical protein
MKRGKRQWRILSMGQGGKNGSGELYLGFWRLQFWDWVEAK